MKQFFLGLLLATVNLAMAQTTAFTPSPTTACVGQTITFTNQSTAGSSPITGYTWNFGDGNTATTQNTSHAYATPGLKTIILIVQYQNGTSSNAVANVTINPNPVAAFTASTNGCSLPVGVTFNNGSSTGMNYAWNFGNGQTSTLQSPATVNYATANTYNVSLTVTNPTTGCTSTATQALVVNNFQAGITAPNTACVGTPVTINDNSTVGANSWSWSFPGASPGTSTTQNNSVVYSAPGTYTISLTSQNLSSGCTGTTTKQITILPSPVPSFTATPLTGCAPQAVAFTNTSPAGSNFVWTFGDGTTFNGQNPTPHNYANNGTYSVTLSMTGSNGCQGSVTMSNLITLNPPVASFTSNVVDGCAPLDVQFTSTSTSTNPIVSWVWQFGDGTTFNGQNPPVHTYPIGVYDVILTITTQSGCVGSDTIAEYIQVGQVDLVNFTIDQSPECAKRSIDFTNLSVINTPHDPDEVEYFWDFGDGGTSTQESPSYSYATDTGYFDVMLIVNFRGCRDTLIMTDAVYIKAPISNFQTQQLYCNPASFPVTVSVTDNSIIGAIPDDADMIWRWGDNSETHFDDPDFDDSDKGSTSHNYTGYGDYTIKQVIVNHTTGCADSTTFTIQISRAQAIISPLANDSVCVGSSFSFNGNNSNSFTPLHPITQYQWSMGDGTVLSGNSQSYAYPNFGSYNIQLTVTNSAQCSHTATVPIKALALPLAQINAADDSGCDPFQVTFTNGSVSQGNGVPLSPVASFTYTNPNGNPTTQTTTNVATNIQDVFHTTTTVTLVATDQFGCVSPAATETITITKPVASFNVDAVVCDEELFTATNTSTSGAIGSAWFIGNPDATPDQVSTNFTHAFNVPNNPNSDHTDFVLTLIVADANGCLDTISHPVTVSKPVANVDFELSGAEVNANGQYVCPPVFADFTDQSLSYGTFTSNWSFGDGNTSTLTNPSNTYLFPNTYTVTMTLTDQYGCTSDTTLPDFLVVLGPTATPSWTQDLTQCGQDITFHIGNTNSVTSISWNLDDGSTSTEPDFLHTYQNITSYNPTVTVEDDNGCKVVYPLNTITIPDNGLNAFFTVNPTEIQLGTTVLFDNQSTSVSPIVNWTWNLGNQDPFNASNGGDVSNIYYSPGSYTVTLLIKDAQGCFDQYQVTIVVDGNFSMPNVITSNGDGLNDYFEFEYDIFQSFDVVIVNRWGNTISERSNQTGTIFWDGRDRNGQLVSEGVYFYILSGKYLDGTPVKKDGFVQVFR